MVEEVDPDEIALLVVVADVAEIEPVVVDRDRFDVVGLGAG